MTNNKISGRKLKKKALELIQNKDFDEAIQEISILPAGKVINPLISFLYNTDENVKWRAVSAIGLVVNSIEENNTESARIIMRRLIWNLNDESGGIGWGSPEAMGEIMAVNETMANEYSGIYLSYVKPCVNFIENEELQKGVLWGLGRLAHKRPEHVKILLPHYHPYINSSDPLTRGLALWIMNALKTSPPRKILENLINDSRKIKIYYEGKYLEFTVEELAGMILEKRFKN